ncbi:hypothetical protein BKI52_17065 [marine bacterium AO1-C]|nr:hypothetical protein BKI52_17065 [marine bacterium AO1-C]
MIIKPVTHFLSILLLLFSFNVSAQNIIARIDTGYANIKQIEVNAGFCRVEIGAISENGRVEFFGEISSEKKPKVNHHSPYQFKHQVYGNTLKVWLQGRHRGSGFSESRLMFKVPPQTNIRVRNNSGSIYAFGLSGDYAKLETRSGSIKAQYINAKIAQFRSFSGYIKVENLNSQEVSFNSHSGSFRLTDAKAGHIQAKNHQGSQRWINVRAQIEASCHQSTIRVIGGKGKVMLNSHQGTLRVYDYVGEVYARNYSGSIRLKNVHGRMDLQANSGSIIGEGVLLMNQSRLQSSSGYIKMKLKNELNKLDYDLRSSSGSVKIGDDRYGKKYVVRNGNKTLVRANSSSGNMFFGKYDEEK